jgi:DNA (cytosine-5)-methyltransferase 1
MRTTNLTNRPTVGSLFAGIGGFDPIPRAVLADRFPHAQRFEDVRTVGKHNLSPVDCIVGGFPCQDVSSMGKRAGLAGARTGLFWEVIRILQELRPQWLVLENVVGLLHSNAGKDFETVIQALAQSGYVGLWRVLNSSGFGVPQMRRRVYLVAGLGIPPPIELLADASPVEQIPGTFKAQQLTRPADAHAAYTLLAKDTGSIVTLGSENLVCHKGGCRESLERARGIADSGLCAGLDEVNHAEFRAAGNAVTPQVAQWIAEKLIRAM